MGSREEILADFQACTGIDDVEMAIVHLESSNWSLVDAVNKAISDGMSPMPAAMSTSTMPMMSNSSSAAIGISGGSSRGSTSPLLPTTPTDPMDVGSVPSRVSSGVSLADDFYQIPSTSSQRTRMLEFHVQYSERMFSLKVPDNEDVKTLKMLIQSETNVPACSQNLQGLLTHSTSSSSSTATNSSSTATSSSSSSSLSSSARSPFLLHDRRKLSELNLPKENFLYLTSSSPLEPDAQQTNGRPSRSDDEPNEYRLTIRNEANDKVLHLNYPATKTVLSVKMDVCDICKVAVSKQRWRGWPPDISDDCSLAQIGLPRVHSLSFSVDDTASAAVASSASTSALSMPIVNLSSSSTATKESESDVDDIQPDDDYYDDLFGPTRSRAHSLIPDDYGDEEMAAIKFGEEFTARYGQPHPHFFPGNLEQALRESCLKPAKERKMLAIYLHHDCSVLSNVFCTQVLCSPSVIRLLDDHFVSFGWDLTHSTNRARAVQFINNHFGSVAASRLRHMDVESLPIIAMAYRLRGSTEIFQIVQGNVTLDELVSVMLTAVETYQSQLSMEIREDEERVARDAVKREQDLAYEMSLAADREKEAQKIRQEAERVLRQQLEAEAKRKAEEERAEQHRLKVQLRDRLRRRLPAEPSKDTSLKTAQLRFRVPATHTRQDEESTADQGSTTATMANDDISTASSRQWLERRFLATESLQTVLDYLTVEGYPSDEYKVLSSWPRRDMTLLDRHLTLEELKLCPQETLTLEEKH